MRAGTFQSGAPETTNAFESNPGKLHGVPSNFDWNLLLLSLPKLKRNRLARTRHIASSNKNKVILYIQHYHKPTELEVINRKRKFEKCKKFSNMRDWLKDIAGKKQHRVL